MARPTLLVAEPEPIQALSTRKLVLETAKFNVLTAHTGGEFLELVKRLPQVDCAIVHSEIADMPCPALLKWARELNPRVTTIFLAAAPGASCQGADHIVQPPARGIAQSRARHFR